MLTLWQLTAGEYLSRLEVYPLGGKFQRPVAHTSLGTKVGKASSGNWQLAGQINSSH